MIQWTEYHLMLCGGFTYVYIEKMDKKLLQKHLRYPWKEKFYREA